MPAADGVRSSRAHPQAAQLRPGHALSGDRLHLRRSGAPTVNDAWNYSFAANTLYDQALADRGYVVFSVDPRSATGQSKTLENTTLRSMQTDGVLHDIVAGVQWLKKQAFVDPSRVGVWDGPAAGRTRSSS